MQLTIHPDDSASFVIQTAAIPHIGEQIVVDRGENEHDLLYVVNNVRYVSIPYGEEMPSTNTTSLVKVFVSFVCYLR